MTKHRKSESAAPSGLNRTELEVAAGRAAGERHAMHPAIWRSLIDVQLSTIAESDPAVTLPKDVLASIARGQAAIAGQGPCARGRSMPEVITAVTDQDLQDRRDANLRSREAVPKGTRRQPPMLTRMQVVMILVDRLLADGVPFGVGPNSRLNQAIREWLNARASRSTDVRRSRRKQITPTAVRALLKQVKAEGRAVPRRTAQRRRTTQEEAAERLRQLRAGRATGGD